jgi:hypothetical protein
VAALAALAADRRHVCAVLADGLAPLLAGAPRLLGVELVGVAAGVGGAAAGARNLALPGAIHAGKSAVAGAATL